MRWPGRSAPVTTDTTSTTPLPVALDDLLNGVEARGARHARPQSQWRWAGPVSGAAVVMTLSVLAWWGVSAATAPEPNRPGPLPAVVEPSDVDPSLPVLDEPVPPRADPPRRTRKPKPRTPSPTPERTSPSSSPAPTVTVTETTERPSSPPPLFTPRPSEEPDHDHDN